MGLNLEFEMSVLSDLGGCWDVFLARVLAKALNLPFFFHHVLPLNFFVYYLSFFGFDLLNYSLDYFK